MYRGKKNINSYVRSHITYCKKTQVFYTFFIGSSSRNVQGIIVLHPVPREQRGLSPRGAGAEGAHRAHALPRCRAARQPQRVRLADLQVLHGLGVIVLRRPAAPPGAPGGKEGVAGRLFGLVVGLAPGRAGEVETSALRRGAGCAHGTHGIGGIRCSTICKLIKMLIR